MDQETQTIMKFDEERRHLNKCIHELKLEAEQLQALIEAKLAEIESLNKVVEDAHVKMGEQTNTILALARKNDMETKNVDEQMTRANKLQESMEEMKERLKNVQS